MDKLLDEAKGEVKHAEQKVKQDMFGEEKKEACIYSRLNSCKVSDLTQLQSFQSHSETRQEFHSTTQNSYSKFSTESSSHTSSFTELTDAQKFSEGWMPLQGKEDHKCGSMFDSNGQKFDGWMNEMGDMCDRNGEKMDGKACEMFNEQGEQVEGWMKEDGVLCNELGLRMEGVEVFDSEGRKVEPMSKKGKVDKVCSWC
jgi:hypothetical protein